MNSFHPKTSLMRNPSVSAALIALLILHTATLGANAAITFAPNAADPNDLEITISAPVDLTFNYAAATDGFGLILAGVYDAPQGPILTTTAVAPSLTLSINGVTSDAQMGGIAGVAGGALTAHDIGIVWEFVTDQPFVVGDLATVNAGVYILDDYLLTFSLPDNSPTTLLLVDNETAIVLSDPLTVPEPSALAFIACGTLGMALRRTRR